MITRDELGDKIDKIDSSNEYTSSKQRTMREGPLSHKYIKVGDRIGLMVKKDISPDQMTGTGAMVQTAIPDRIIEVVDLGDISEETADRVVEKGTEMRDMVTTTIEIGTDQGKEHL